jgi:chemotaxis protein histidine kinase CheA
MGRWPGNFTGEGARFTFDLPLALSAVRVLLVAMDGEFDGLPLGYVDHVLTARLMTLGPTRCSI